MERHAYLGALRITTGYDPGTGADSTVLRQTQKEVREKMQVAAVELQ